MTNDCNVIAPTPQNIMQNERETAPRGARWSIELQPTGQFWVKVVRPGVSGETSCGMFLSFARAAFIVSAWAMPHDTVTVCAPGDLHDRWSAQVVEDPGTDDVLVMWAEAVPA
jgi:hypothetical protein